MTTNWAGNVTYSTDRVLRPESVADLQALVVAASAAGRRVSAIGSRHSFSRVADTDGDLLDMSGFRSIELDGEGVLIGSGVRYADLGPVLHAAGRALPNLPSLPHVTVAGAVATATHGSGDRNGSLAAPVEEVELVTADGEVRSLRRGDADFDGAVVSLGALGVVTRLRLRTEPTFDVAQTVFRALPMRSAILHLDEIMALAYSVSLFTDWRSVDQVWIKRRLDRDPVPPPEVFGAVRAERPCHPVPGVSAEACTRQLGVPGPWHERLAHFRPDAVPSAGDELQSEYFVDRVAGSAALAAVAGIADVLAPLLLVSEVRSIAADSQWLSMSSDTATLGLHFTWRRDPVALAAVLPVLERALEPFHPRPHWAKISSIDAELIAGRYAHLAAFSELASRLDPAGVFRNPVRDALLH